MRAPGRVWFHRGRAVLWAVFGGVSFMTGWANNIALVWFASIYANIVSDWGAGEAADDTEVLERLDAIAARLDRLHTAPRPRQPRRRGRRRRNGR